jgi:hypothetical protein
MGRVRRHGKKIAPAAAKSLATPGGPAGPTGPQGATGGCPAGYDASVRLTKQTDYEPFFGFFVVFN